MATRITDARRPIEPRRTAPGASPTTRSGAATTAPATAAVPGAAAVDGAQNASLRGSVQADRYDADAGQTNRQRGPTAANDLAPALALRESVATNDVGPATLVEEERMDIDVASASGLVTLKDGTFLVIDDDKGIYHVNESGESTKVKSSSRHEELTDLEGMCLGPDGNSVLVVAERTRKVFQLKLERDGDEVELKSPKELGKLPRLGERGSNSGWEGLELMAGRFFPDGKPRLVAVHEKEPRRIGIFSFPDLENPILLKLPSDAKRHMPDLSDITVCPETGHLFVLSDEGATVAEFALKNGTGGNAISPLEPPSLVTIGLTEIEANRREKPEGLAFGDDGRLYMTMDGESKLAVFTLERD